MKPGIRRLAALFPLLLLCAAGLQGQQTSGSAPTLSVSSTLVQVPALVKTRDGQPVFELTAADFVVTDDGAPQKITIDPETDSQPLALVICVETGAAGARHLEDYRRLDAVVDALIGNVQHRVGLVAIDSQPHLLVPFTPDTDQASRMLRHLNAGDPGAAILDGVAYAVDQLRQQPAGYRRAVLLLSETLDQGSRTTLTEALRLISDTNTTMYSFGFSSTRSAVSHEAGKFNQEQPGPAHGCFSRDGADAEYQGHYSKQVLDCISQLAPPLRLATMAFVAARDGLRRNTAESIAHLTGGEFVHFKNAKDLRAKLIAVSNDVPNAYVLSFRPSAPTVGLHALHVTVRGRPDLVVRARTEYWMEAAGTR